MEDKLKKQFDYDELLERYEFNESIIERVIPIAIQGFNDSITKLIDCFQAKDLNEIKHIAHRLKGTARSLSLPILIQLNEELEVMDFENNEQMRLKIESIVSELKIIIGIFESIGKR